jgi:hypothetical protein
MVSVLNGQGNDRGFYGYGYGYGSGYGSGSDGGRGVMTGDRYD